MAYWDQPGASDEWYTPPEVFDALGCTFDLDPANAAIGGANVPCRTSYGADGLEKPWHGFVWLNPPFGGRNALKPWLDRFFDHGEGIALTPDRTSASPWFWPAWERADLVLFTRKIRFIRPDGSQGKSPSNGTALWAAGARACDALRRASALRFGILAAPLPSTARLYRPRNPAEAERGHRHDDQYRLPSDRNRLPDPGGASLTHPTPSPQETGR